MGHHRSQVSLLLFAATACLIVSHETAAFQTTGILRVVTARTLPAKSSSTSLSFALDGMEPASTAVTAIVDTMISTTTSNMVVAAEDSVESWRQYVPLVVSLLVIVDILLGSPVANSVLGIVRAQEAQNDAEDSNDAASLSNLSNINTKGERVDSESVASAAIEKAKNTLLWNTERERLKTDADRMEDIRRKMDNQLREFDEKKRQP